MREYELEILEQYEIEIKGTRRIRGAFFCDTDKGAMLLKETGISEKRASFMYYKESCLEALGMAADTPVFTKDGTLLAVSRDGTKYIMKKWYAGRECDLKKWHCKYFRSITAAPQKEEKRLADRHLRPAR